MNRRSFIGACIGAFVAATVPTTATPEPVNPVCLIQSPQSLRATYGFDAERELTEAMARSIVEEIDAEILADLRIAA
jgi:hypothetical protein